MLVELEKHWVNAWVLAKDLPALAKASADPKFRELCSLVRKNYKYPVDTVLIRPTLEVVGHKNANQAMGEGPIEYLRFLRAARGASPMGPRPAERASVSAPGQGAPKTGRAFGKKLAKRLVLKPAQPQASLLDVLRVKKGRSPFSGFYQIDVTAFAKGGKLSLDLELRLSEAAASFELCEISRMGGHMVLRPVRKSSLVKRGGKTRIDYSFPTGRVLHLGARGDGEDGALNAFLLRARVDAR